MLLCLSFYYVNGFNILPFIMKYNYAEQPILKKSAKLATHPIVYKPAGGGAYGEIKLKYKEKLIDNDMDNLAIKIKSNDRKHLDDPNFSSLSILGRQYNNANQYTGLKNLRKTSKAT